MGGCGTAAAGEAAANAAPSPPGRVSGGRTRGGGGGAGCGAGKRVALRAADVLHLGGVEACPGGGGQRHRDGCWLGDAGAANWVAGGGAASASGCEMAASDPSNVKYWGGPSRQLLLLLAVHKGHASPGAPRTQSACDALPGESAREVLLLELLP